MQYPVVDNNGHVNDLVQEHVRKINGFLDKLQLWETTISSTLAPENLHDSHNGESTTSQRNATAELQFSPLSDQSPVFFTPTGMSTTNPRNAPWDLETQNMYP